MKSARILVPLLLTVLLLGCNRPASEPPADDLATMVAVTLTAQGLSPTGQVPLSPSPPAPSVSSPAPLPSATPTVEPTLAASPTSTAPALPADDPRSGLNLASPDYRDDFSQRGSWFEYPADFEDAIIRWEDGRLRASDAKADSFLWWSTTGVPGQDSYVEVTAEVADCSGLDAYGIAIRVDPSSFDQAYTLEISCDGQFRFRKFVSEAAPIVLANWSPSAAILTGSGAINRIGLLAVDDRLHGFVNGQLLNQTAIQDVAYESGIFGLFSSAAQTAGLTAYFDTFQLWFVSS